MEREPGEGNFDVTNLREPATARNSKTPLAYVYDGRECLGHIVARGKTGFFEAFDRDDKSIGIFESQRQAANALVERAANGGPQ